ncbi:MAG: transcription antitermination factor NusB [Bacteroidetes bacterium]|nr:transcription antitermination factor NusB [Bacteroidota bacterium]
MLGRRHYRVKVLQALYAFFQGGEPRMEIAEKNLLKSIEMVYQLFSLQFSFLFELMHFYEYRMEESKNKFLPTVDELNPSLKLLNNRFLKILLENQPLKKQIERYSISWTEEQELVRKTNMKLKASKDLQAYLNSGENSFEEDRNYLIKLFRKNVANNSDLRSFCEERSIHWHDDFDVASGYAIKALMILPEHFKNKEDIIYLFTKDNEDEAAESNEFITQLFRLTIVHSEEFEKLISARSKNWELERIALTDIIILKMALAEVLYFPYIPVKVSLNEYIEISKHFSTQKSKQFINGILDKLAADLKEQDLIKKSGRGLIQ